MLRHGVCHYRASNLFVICLYFTDLASNITLPRTYLDKFLQHLMLSFLLLLGFQKRVICLLLDIRDMLVGVGRQWGLEDSRIHLDRMTSVEQLLDLEDDLNSDKKKQQLLVG